MRISAAGNNRGSSNFWLTMSSSGVQAMDNATAKVNWSATAASIAPAVTANPNSTKPNSPPCARVSANAVRWRAPRPATHATAYNTVALSATKAAVKAMSGNGFSSSKPKSTAMPTEMKNKPSNNPLNGSMSDSSA